MLVPNCPDESGNNCSFLGSCVVQNLSNVNFDLADGCNQYLMLNSGGVVVPVKKPFGTIIYEYQSGGTPLAHPASFANDITITISLNTVTLNEYCDPPAPHDGITLDITQTGNYWGSVSLLYTDMYPNTALGGLYTIQAYLTNQTTGLETAFDSRVMRTSFNNNYDMNHKFPIPYQQLTAGDKLILSLFAQSSGSYTFNIEHAQVILHGDPLCPCT